MKTCGAAELESIPCSGRSRLLPPAPKKQRMDSLRLPSKSSNGPELAVTGAPWRRVLAPVLLAAALPAAAPGCSDDAPLATVTYRLAPPPPVDGAGACTEGPGDGPLLPGDQAADRVRLTYWAADTGELVCDVVLAPAEGAPVVAVPEIGRVDLRVEIFAPDSTLLARGDARAVDLAAVPEVGVTVRPAGQFSCADDRGAAGRAFHSATPLPSGEILLAGGVRPASDGAAVDLDGDGLYLSGAVELYDPVTGTFTPVSVPGLIPRALHEAFVLAPPGSPGDPVTVALVGGLTVAGDPALAPGLVAGSAGLRLEPGASAVEAPIELLTYDPATGTIQREVVETEDGAPVPGMFSAAALVGSGSGPGRVLVTGGWGGGTDQPLDALQLVDPGAAEAVDVGLATGRMGASVTALDDGRALIWGGHLAASEDSEPALVTGELVDDLDTDAPATVALALEGAAPTPRAFHSAVLVAGEGVPDGRGGVLALGGFDITAVGVAVTPAAILAQHLAVDEGATVTVRNVDLVDGTTPPGAAYVAAAPLPGGDVLVTGGNPGPDAGCATGAAGLVCSRGLTYRYRADVQRFEAAAGLVRERYGHRATLLADGTVLVTGGLAVVDGQLQVLRDAEIYTLADADPLDRAPGQVAQEPGGTPVAPCLVLDPSE